MSNDYESGDKIENAQDKITETNYRKWAEELDRDLSLEKCKEMFGVNSGHKELSKAFEELSKAFEELSKAGTEIDMNIISAAYNQGENPDLSESDAEKIRQHIPQAVKDLDFRKGYSLSHELCEIEQAGARIYSGKNQAKCSICGHDIPAPPGVCVACPTCGSNFGACG